MKALLHPDPKQRLGVDKIFSHPYFENMSSNYHIAEDKKEATLPSTNKNTYISTSVPKKIISNDEDKIAKLTSQREKEKEKDIKEKETSINKKQSQQMITNTTNINIINYNNFDNDKEKIKNANESTPKNALKTINNIDEKKLYQDKKVNNKKDLILTSTSFNKSQLKDNLNTIYGKTNLDGNFKTFYKEETYNYDIDLNYANKKSSSPDELDEKKNRTKFGLTKNTFGNVSNIYKDSEYFEGKHQNNSNQQVVNNKIGKKKIIEKKFKANNIIIEESYQPNNQSQVGKLSPNKQENVKHNTNNSNNPNNHSNYKQNYNIQLPTIGNKGYNFNYKKGK
jgi:hypothetical protein